MAEFCLSCWNQINNANDLPQKYIISKALDLCEGCGEWKNVIIAEKRHFSWHTGKRSREQREVQK